MATNSEVRLPAEADPQGAPVSYELNGATAIVKIDHVISTHGRLIVSGWSSDQGLSVVLASADGPMDASVVRSARQDVASGLQRADGSRLGFVAVTGETAENEISIVFGDGKAQFRFQLSLDDTFSDDAKFSCAPGIFSALTDQRVGSRHWKTLLSLLPERSNSDLIVEGVIDVAYSSPVHSNGFAKGWITHKSNTTVWLEDDCGHFHDIASGYRWLRRDVRAEIHSLPGPGQKCGFHMRATFPAEARSVRICAANQDGIQKLAARPLSPLPSKARSALVALLEAVTPRHDLPARIRHTDLPFLSAVRSAERKIWQNAEIRTRVIGEIPENPQLSVIIPLFGRIDLIEHQLLEFDRDPDFRERVEIIYVLDDPDLENPLHFDGARLQSVSGPGFRWITDGDNRGFSGANNLGASIARGQVLIFMNSDVIPLRSGWATKLAKSLDANSGLVSPRLLFPNGSIQHAGMSPRWRPEWELFTNHHPGMGMEPSFDPSKKPLRVPLVTGACMMLARDTFKRIDGWDEEYISGDFEDSDLCLKIREIGLDVIYDPTVELIHLERQSFELSSEDMTLHERTTLVNACRYNQKWHRQIRELAN